jgi:hypothetical protein
MLLTENRIPSSAFFMGKKNIEIVCVGAKFSFWIGALKHRDIHGTEVSSQVKRKITDYKCVLMI